MMLAAFRPQNIPAAGLMGLLAVAACGTSAASAGEKLRETVIAGTPTERAIAASNRFFDCRDGKVSGEHLCYDCQVTLHERIGEGLVAYASDYEHLLRPWEEGGEPRITVTGERGDARFTSEQPTAEAAREIFNAANAWCESRDKGSFRLLKDEIETHFSGKGE